MITKKKLKYRSRRARKPIWRAKFFWFGILTLAVLAGLIYLAAFWPVLQVKEIKVSGTATLAASDVQAFAQHELSSYVPALGSKSILLINKSDLTNKLLKEFVRIAELKITRELPATLRLQINERQALAIFCRIDCFWLDKQGVVFSAASAGQLGGNQELSVELRAGEATNFPLIQDKRGAEPIALGQQVLAAPTLVKLLVILTGANGLVDLVVDELALTSDAKAELSLAGGGRVIFSLQDDSAFQLQNLRVVLEKQIPLALLSELDYIDLRFGSKVYYKFKSAG